MNTPVLFTINAGSSSIKFAIYEVAAHLQELARGQISAIGGHSHLTVHLRGALDTHQEIDTPDHSSALDAILAACAPLLEGHIIAGVGHRVVHGGTAYTTPVVITDQVLDALAQYQPLAPLHQPHNLAGIRAARHAFPDAVQVACFDTAFHRGHPWVNDTFALPREYYNRGVRRYGFHGLSYEYLSGALKREAPELHAGRVIIAHLGNGASMCAVKNGISVGSTMGFSALDGLPMGTRCGQIDPGVLLYLIQEEGMDAEALSDLLFKQSGLKGLSGISNDLRVLEASAEPAAKQAIDYFVFRIRRELGAMTPVLGGLDGLVFSGGIGENSARIRREVCAGLDWLGISLDQDANNNNARDIGTGAVRVMVIPTDEERVIARATREALEGHAPSGKQ
ncbi:acetate/propionate family kinase [Granulosicoccaceae sp. 1_MG-2023]|nr:acetate/propionate family kinase [Granulosicoccaceae sp. 1_MG-2023]